MPPHEEDYRNGFIGGQLFIKDENGQYTPFMGIQDCTNTIAAELDENGQYTPFPGIQVCTATIATELDDDGQEWTYEGIDWANGSDFTVTCYMNKHDSRRFWKVMRRLDNKGRRIRRHEKRLKERARRSVLKQRDWFVLRDKDGGQVCIDWHKRPNEPGRFFVRYKRKRVRTDEE